MSDSALQSEVITVVLARLGLEGPPEVVAPESKLLVIIPRTVVVARDVVGEGVPLTFYAMGWRTPPRARGTSFPDCPGLGLAFEARWEQREAMDGGYFCRIRLLAKPLKEVDLEAMWSLPERRTRFRADLVDLDGDGPTWTIEFVPPQVKVGPEKVVVSRETARESIHELGDSAAQVGARLVSRHAGITAESAVDADRMIGKHLFWPGVHDVELVAGDGRTLDRTRVVVGDGLGRFEVRRVGPNAPRQFISPSSDQICVWPRTVTFDGGAVSRTVWVRRNSNRRAFDGGAQLVSVLPQSLDRMGPTVSSHAHPCVKIDVPEASTDFGPHPVITEATLRVSADLRRAIVEVPVKGNVRCLEEAEALLWTAAPLQSTSAATLHQQTPPGRALLRWELDACPLRDAGPGPYQFAMDIPTQKGRRRWLMHLWVQSCPLFLDAVAPRSLLGRESKTTVLCAMYGPQLEGAMSSDVSVHWRGALDVMETAALTFSEGTLASLPNARIRAMAWGVPILGFAVEPPTFANGGPVDLIVRAGQVTSMVRLDLRPGSIDGGE